MGCFTRYGGRLICHRYIQHGTAQNHTCCSLLFSFKNRHSCFLLRCNLDFQVGPEEEGMAHYCLTSTVMLSLTTNNESTGTFNLSGSIRRQVIYAILSKIISQLQLKPSACLRLHQKSYTVNIGKCFFCGTDVKFLLSS